MSATRGLVEAVGDGCAPDRRSSRVANDRVALLVNRGPLVAIDNVVCEEAKPPTTIRGFHSGPDVNETARQRASKVCQETFGDLPERLG